MMLKDINEFSNEEFELQCWKEFYKSETSCYRYVGNIQLDYPDVELTTYPFEYNPNIDSGKFPESGKEKIDSNSAYFHKRAYFNQDTELYCTIKNYLKADFMTMLMNLQCPGWMTPVHFDKNRTLCRKIIPKNIYYTLPVIAMKKFVIFLQDHELGHNFQIGYDHLKWKAGDIFEWEWYAPHCTSNHSKIDRQSLSVACIRT